MAAATRQFTAPPRLARWWAAKAPSERRVIAALALLVVAALGWVAVWQPLQQDLAALRAAAAAERSALAEGQRIVADIAGLARATPLPPPPDAQAELARVLAERGLRATAAPIDWQQGQARMTLEAVRFDALVAALDALQRDARLRVVEATLTARVEPGTVRAELVLAR